MDLNPHSQGDAIVLTADEISLSPQQALKRAEDNFERVRIYDSIIDKITDEIMIRKL